MNTVDLIENDFKSLQTEFKKKFTQIKEVNNFALFKYCNSQ